MAHNPNVLRAIELLRRQKVRQGEITSALDVVIAQAIELAYCEEDRLRDAAMQIKGQALELRRIGNAVPKFVIDDLLEESIARLEAVAQR